MVGISNLNVQQELNNVQMAYDRLTAGRF